MSEIITASNLDLVIFRNKEIRDEISTQALKLQMNPTYARVSSMPQLALLILKEFGLIQVPIEDKYWSGAIFVKDGKQIPVINTALPRANQYYTAWHEIYHLIFDEVSLDHYIENEYMIEERKAEYFASCMVLTGVEKYYSELPEMEFVSKVYCCMSAFQAPYKAVLISLYEEAVKTDNEKLQNQIKTVFDYKSNNLSSDFSNLGLDNSLVLPSYVINASFLQNKIKTEEENNPELIYHFENEDFLKNIIGELRLSSNLKTC